MIIQLGSDFPNWNDGHLVQDSLPSHGDRSLPDHVNDSARRGNLSVVLYYSPYSVGCVDRDNLVSSRLASPRRWRLDIEFLFQFRARAGKFWRTPATTQTRSGALLNKLNFDVTAVVNYPFAHHCFSFSSHAGSQMTRNGLLWF